MRLRPEILSFALALLIAYPSVSSADGSVLRFDPAWDYPVLATGLVAAGSGYWIESSLADRSYDPAYYSRQDLPALDRWASGYYSKPLADATDYLVLGLGAIPLVQAGLDLRSHRETFPEVWDDLVIYGEVVVFATAASYYSKTLRVHPRPLVFSDDAPLSDRRSGDSHSAFFSVHTTGAFAAATWLGTTFQMEHPESAWIPWVWAGGLGLASGVGAMRILSGQHYPTDVLAGAVVGSVIGFGIPWLHAKPHGPRDHKAPGDGSNGGTGKASGSFRGPTLMMRLGPLGLTPTIAFRF